jgi:hypothetical protein
MGVATQRRVDGGLESMRKTANTQQKSATGISMQAPCRVCKIEVLSAFRFFVQFEDGTDGLVDMAQFLEQDYGVFKSLRDVDIFNAAFIQNGVVTWPGELDLAPDRMHDELQNSKVYIVGKNYD